MANLLNFIKRQAAKIALGKAQAIWRAKGGPSKSVTFGAFLVDEQTARRGFELPMWLEIILPPHYADALTSELTRQANEFIEAETQRPFVQILHRRGEHTGYVWYAIPASRPTNRVWRHRP